ncbi:cytochrome C biogenesis protein [Oceanobacillus sp. CFH 90083]|uniref:cytochrome C biogenesis protein n=1 Tax=Oceanobacillus sp. CFH 90083 TaxID=2592336 RepID=UPI00128B42CC|nr:cytochrome C biogenesis protein [Oceanobacillus sp. CFH 90083]
MKINYVKVEVLIAEEYISSLREQLHEHGFLHYANQDNVLSYTKYKHYSRPLELASLDMSLPIESEFLQTVNKVEFRCMIHQVEKVKKIIHDIHPSNHPMMYFIPILD